MCGIVGIVGEHGQDLLGPMKDLLRHRGPDDQSEYWDPHWQVGLAIRRLSILDLAGGKQPMPNEDKSVWVVCNGEIYNSPELRLHLMSRGHQFMTTNSDIEVLVHLYEEKGKEMLKDLNGMFAFVIYDYRNKLLFGARDRMGIKPFYYVHKDGAFAFASELKSLLLLPNISREINFDSLNHYLSLQFVPAPDSIFSDIKKLQAGHCFTYFLERKQLEVERYWRLNFNHTKDRPLVEWRELVYNKLQHAVKRWTLSDVPVACSLSGGLDSSTIAGLLAESGIRHLRTYSLGFGRLEEQSFNELPLARKVAEKWGSDHHEVVIEPSRILDDLNRMVWHLDEPYGGGLPSWYIYEFIGRDCKVAMTGIGGDELFGNYAKWKIFERQSGYRWIKNILQAGRWRSWNELKNGHTFPHGHFYHRYLSDAVKEEVILAKKEQLCELGTEQYLEQMWEQSGNASPRNAVAYIDFNLQLPEEFLLMTDRFSMAHSVEARTPFLDHELVELVFRIPPEVRTRNGDPKYLLKQIIGHLLPEELLSAPKRGFILPLTIWTRKDLRPLIEDWLSPAYLQRQGLFSTRVYDRLVKPHIHKKSDFTHQVWTLLMFQMWYQTFCENTARVDT